MYKYFLVFLIFASSGHASEFKQLVAKYCLECHGGKKTKGGVDFKGYKDISHIYKNHQAW